MTPCFHFITLFPDTIDVWLKSSILGRALEKGVFTYRLHQLRDYSKNKHRTVDDVAYGGGGGMVLCVEPLARAVEAVKASVAGESAKVIYFSPAGRKLSQEMIGNFLQAPLIQHFILICGHYEGVDQRFIDGWVDEEVSLGDFVLTGGELPAVAFADALIRHLPETLGYESAPKEESFSIKSGETPLLEYPHYTRPVEFEGRKVPLELTSGNHQLIQQWRLSQAQSRTRLRRPDLESRN